MFETKYILNLINSFVWVKLLFIFNIKSMEKINKTSIIILTSQACFFITLEIELKFDLAFQQGVSVSSPIINYRLGSHFMLI